MCHEEKFGNAGFFRWRFERKEKKSRRPLAMAKTVTPSAREANLEFRSEKGAGPKNQTPGAPRQRRFTVRMV